MSHLGYLLDTHALLFWHNKESMSAAFIRFIDQQEQTGRLFVSPISFWEIALLVKRGKVRLGELQVWRSQLQENTGIQILTPTAAEMIDSVNLPELHKDPFDRLLIAQAKSNDCLLITRDSTIKQYDTGIFWM